MWNNNTLRLSLTLGDLSCPLTSIFFLTNTRKSTENSAFVFNVIRRKLKMRNICSLTLLQIYHKAVHQIMDGENRNTPSQSNLSTAYYQPLQIVCIECTSLSIRGNTCMNPTSSIGPRPLFGFKYLF